MFCVFVRYASAQPSELHTFMDWDSRVSFVEALSRNREALSYHTWTQPKTVALLPMYAKAVRVPH